MLGSRIVSLETDVGRVSKLQAFCYRGCFKAFKTSCPIFHFFIELSWAWSGGHVPGGSASGLVAPSLPRREVSFRASADWFTSPHCADPQLSVPHWAMRMPIGKLKKDPPPMDLSGLQAMHPATVEQK
eukprot:6460617-Amphidinium_carterae.1